LLVATHAWAADFTWSGGSGGSGDAWRQPNNWRPSSGRGGPGSGDVAIFTTNGSALSIGINFNDGLGLTTQVGSIVLASGPDRRVVNSAPNSAGILRLQGSHGLLLANHSTSSVLSLRNGVDSRMRIELVSGGTIHVGSPSAGIELAGEVAGTHGFVKTGKGWLRLSQSNSLAGSVTVRGGSLELASAAGSSLGSVAQLRIETGASAVLSAPHQLGPCTALDFAGGTLRGGTGTAPIVENAGTLTLSANSTIDLGVSEIHFADSSGITWATSSVLTITNWGGSVGSRLFFGPGGLTGTQLAQIYFADIGVQGAQLVGPHGELCPIPEAPVSAAAAAVAAFIVWKERRRLVRWWRRVPRI
jgi:autotransporter-associated beta strand protein